MKKKLWIVYWWDDTGYVEFTELWSTENQAQLASEKYQESWKNSGKYFTYEEIELMK